MEGQFLAFALFRLPRQWPDSSSSNLVWHGTWGGLNMKETSPDFATAAWLLEDSSLPQTNLCCGITHVSGPPSEANAYHAELQGLHSLLMAI